MGKTSIEWTDAVWNPITGCREVSPGCANCYAARLAGNRLKNLPEYKGLADKRRGEHRWTGEVRFHPERLEEPLRWRKPRRIFVCDMADLFHEGVFDSTLVKIFATMLATPRHTYQVLTKRAERMNGFVSKVLPYLWTYPRVPVTVKLPLPNVWLGVSVENQHFADERIPLLLETPAAVRWISAEPLLGPVDLRFLQFDKLVEINALQGTHGLYRPHAGVNQKLDWVVCGGESGPNARPMHPDWARSLRDQCQSAGVPFFFKQWGEWAEAGMWETTGSTICRATMRVNGDGPLMAKVGKKAAGRLFDGREHSEWPRQGAHGAANDDFQGVQR